MASARDAVKGEKRDFGAVEAYLLLAAISGVVWGVFRIADSETTARHEARLRKIDEVGRRASEARGDIFRRAEDAWLAAWDDPWFTTNEEGRAAARDGGRAKAANAARDAVLAEWEPLARKFDKEIGARVWSTGTSSPPPASPSNP